MRWGHGLFRRWRLLLLLLLFGFLFLREAFSVPSIPIFLLRCWEESSGGVGAFRTLPASLGLALHSLTDLYFLILLEIEESEGVCE